jgi:hypothetical protein
MPGDVNDDHLVNITDVSLLINYLMGSTTLTINTVNADVNSDNNINVSDVTMLINMIMSAE